MLRKVDIRSVNAKMCDTCVFREGQKIVPPQRVGEIQEYLIQGTNHVCHTTDKICRGARDYQLTIFHRMGIILEPTDEALYIENDKVMNNENYKKRTANKT